MITFIKSTLLALAVAGAVSSCATTTSPTGRHQVVGGISQQELDQEGAQAFAQMKAQKPQTQDARQRGYTTCVVNTIVAQLPPEWQQYRWETAVFVDNQANAFALPGGKVGLYTGIFRVARNQDELAAVVAHEIGHVVSHHHNERITRTQGAQAGLVLAEILAGITGSQGAVNAVDQFGGTAAQLVLLRYSRVQESEADVVGQQLMAQAGFDPRRAVNLWQNMIAEEGANRPPQWLSTHPDPQARLSELQQRANGLVPVYDRARAAGRRPACG